jgi:hypothetical protein
MALGLNHILTGIRPKSIGFILALLHISLALPFQNGQGWFCKDICSQGIGHVMSRTYIKNMVGAAG